MEGELYHLQAEDLRDSQLVKAGVSTQGIYTLAGLCWEAVLQAEHNLFRLHCLCNAFVVQLC